MSYKCEIIEMEPQPAVAVRALTTYHRLPSTIGDGFRSLRAYLRERGVSAGPTYVRYGRVRSREIPVEVGVAVPQPLGDDGTFDTAALPGGRVATCVHRGPYRDLPHAYKALERWVASQGLAITGESYELYLNDGERTPPSAWLTRISLPLA